MSDYSQIEAVRPFFPWSRVAAMIIFVAVALGCSPERPPSAEQAGEPWASLRAMGDSLHRAAEVGEQAAAAGG